MIRLSISVIILLSLAVALVFHYFSGGLTATLCSNQIHQVYPSPDRSLKAVVFQRECGPSSGATTQVSLLDASSELPNEAGNILVIKGETNTSAPDITWNSSQELIIHHPLDGNAFKAQTDYNSANKSVRIRYQP